MTQIHLIGAGSLGYLSRNKVIIGVMEYWSVGVLGTFKTITPFLQYSNFSA
jgi:hypothetical protein